MGMYDAYRKLRDLNCNAFCEVKELPINGERGMQHEKNYWIVRIKNKAFWVALIPALLLLVQAIAAVFGFVIALGDLETSC